MLHGILVRNLVDRRVVVPGESLQELFRSIRPGSVGMWIVGFPAHVVEIEVIKKLRANSLFNEAHQDVIVEDLGWATGLGKVVVDPTAMSIVDMLGAPQEIGNPADIALGQ